MSKYDILTSHGYRKSRKITYTKYFFDQILYLKLSTRITIGSNVLVKKLFTEENKYIIKIKTLLTLLRI